MHLLLALVRRPRGAILIAIGIALAGILALRAMPIAAVPSVDLPVILVTATLPGASPQSMADLVAGPLEETLGSIPGVEEISATNVEGLTRIVLQFDLRRSAVAAGRDVQAAINAARPRLPRAMPAAPVYQKINPSESPALFLAVTSETLPSQALAALARRIVVPELTRQPGVAAALIQGAERPAVRVRADTRALHLRGLRPDALDNAIAAETYDGPLGALDGDHATWPIALSAPVGDAATVRVLAVRSPTGRVGRLEEVAQVSDGPADERTAAWFDGRRTVFVFVQRAGGANLLSTARHVRDALPALQRMLPASVSLHVIADRSDSIAPMVGEVAVTIVLTMVAIALVVFASLRDRTLALVAIVNVPLSLLGAAVGMKLLGYGLNIISLAGITVSIGLVVDDAIVVVENIQRHRARADAGVLTILRATREITLTIVAITLALIATLSPLLVLGGPVGAMVAQFAVTVALALALSGLLSLTLTPVLVAIATRRATGAAPHRHGTLHRLYVAALRRVVRRPLPTLAASLAVMLAAVPVGRALPQALLPLQDTGVVLGIVAVRPDITFPLMAQRIELASRRIAADPGVRSVSSYLGSADAGVASSARLYIALRSGEPVAPAIARLRTRLADLTGLQTSLQPLEDLRVGTREGVGANQLVLRAERSDLLAQWLPVLVDRLRRTASLADVSTDQAAAGASVRLAIDGDALSRLGGSAAGVTDALYDQFGQRQLTLLNRTFDQVPVVVEGPGGRAGEPATVDGVFMAGNAPGGVALSSIARRQVVGSPTIVTHDRLLPSAVISFNVAPGHALGDTVRDITAQVRDAGLPPSIRVGFGGAAGALGDGLFGQPLTFLLAALAVYAVLGILYESLAAPIAIIVLLPAAAIGSLLALHLASMEMTVVAFMGMLLVGGIMLKNAIILVDFATARRAAGGCDAATAMVEAGVQRFRPVQMTTLAAFLGALPIAFAGGMGAEFRQPLGIAVIGGLIAGQAITMFATPALYVVLDRLGARARDARAVAA